jgi:sulfatase maturation enzyme AslB (radical SAM superfamily)
MTMNWQDVVRAWGKTLSGRCPSLSIEITRECPLRCTGCYAYEDDHVGAGLNLRQLQDKKGEALVRGVLEIVDRDRPLHLSIVGGDPLVRFRELCILVPLLSQRGIDVQLVTSAFREIPKEWASIPRLNIVVSIDGLQAEHDIRRRPATYEKILKNISGHQITVHCTITSQMTKRAGYLDDFLAFWTPRAEIKRVWFSIFTPQQGARDAEILSPHERLQTVQEMLRLRNVYRKLDMNERVIQEFLRPPSSPQECIFAQTTRTVSADLKTEIVPCQFGGQPDCSQCGCVASMGLAAVGHHAIGAGVTAGNIYRVSAAAGKAWRKLKRAA